MALHYKKLRDMMDLKIFVDTDADVRLIRNIRRDVVERGRTVDMVLERYEKLNLAPYKGFINPVYTAVKDAQGNITDVKLSYTEGYAEQMLRYSRDYSTLPLINE